MGGLELKIVGALVAVALLSVPVPGYSTVYTSDIANGAVTTPKIADGAVTTAKIGANAVSTGNIANGAVTDAKITGPISGSKLGTHNHSGADITDGTITSSQLADQSVAGSKIASGAITSAHLAAGAVTDDKISSLAAAKLVGTLGADKIATYAGVKVVHKGPADGINTFNTIQDAMLAIGANTVDRYALLLEPGIYEQDFSFLNGYASANHADPNYNKFNVDIIGASRKGSYIHSVGNPYRGIGESQFVLISGIHLRNLTYEGTITMTGSHNTAITDCDLISNGLGGQGAGISFGLFYDTKVENVTITDKGDGLMLYSPLDPQNSVFNNIKIIQAAGANHALWIKTESFAKFSNIVISGSGTRGFGFLSYGSGTVELDNVTVDGQYYSFNHEGGSVKVSIRNSKLDNLTNLFSPNAGGIDMNIVNSVVSNVNTPAGPVRIGNSQINGAIPSTNGSLKLVNDIDGAFDSIANGIY